MECEPLWFRFFVDCVEQFVERKLGYWFVCGLWFPGDGLGDCDTVLWWESTDHNHDSSDYDDYSSDYDDYDYSSDHDDYDYSSDYYYDGFGWGFLLGSSGSVGFGLCGVCDGY